jgi:anti-sigma B factor antagonist
MSVAPKIVIKRTWDVTTVEMQESRLTESYQLDAIGQELFRLVDEMDRKKLVLDFSKVQFLSSSAVGMLMSLHQKSKKIGGAFVICGLRKELLKVFEIMKLTKVLKFAKNESDAISQLG